jgi:phosphoserine aminotransferase
MKADRIHNFNAGTGSPSPAGIGRNPGILSQLCRVGMSVTEISHRSKWFDDVINDAITRVKRILKLDDRYHVLFLQGGASMQFCMVPMNLMGAGDSADYVNTGTWSTKAIKEARMSG